jgi:alpha-1,3-rhamnosyl/mannosyltransferase
MTDAPGTKRLIEVGIDGTSWPNLRGFGRFTREIVKALAARESVFRYSLVVDDQLDASVPDSVRILRVRTGRTLADASVRSGSRSLADLWALSRAIARARFDLFFFPAVWTFVPMLTSTPCVVAFHDTIAERYPELVFPTRYNRWLWRLKVRLACLQAHRVMTVSDASKRDLESILGIREDRIDVVSEAPARPFLPSADRSSDVATRARYGIPDRAPLLLTVGGLSPHKNVLGLLRSFELVLDAHPDAHLAIVGDTSGRGFHDNLPELEDFVRARARLACRIHFTGYVRDEDLAALYHGASALLCASLWEGFGLPAIEAMACGLPVLASRRGSLPEVIGEAGLFFDPDSTEEIASAIARLLGNDELRRRLGECALKRAARFTWDRGASLVEESFLRCLRDRPTGLRCAPS